MRSQIQRYFCFLVPFFVVLLVACNVQQVVAQVDKDDPSNFYQNYSKYPPYCSTPAEMATRKIPHLKPNEHVGDSRLVHVTSIIRHGARAPWSRLSMTCWEGYWDEGEDTAKWDCDLKTTLGTPKEASNYIFDKQYDPLKPPLHNELYGTCQQGQLLWQGYYQQHMNGQLMRDAYVYDSDRFADYNITMRLIDLKDVAPLTEPTILFRSDDDQRTLMSGQIFLASMLGDLLVRSPSKKSEALPTQQALSTQHEEAEKVTFPLHVADRGVDVLAPSEKLCPRLTEIREEASNSEEYKSFMSSNEAKNLQDLVRQELGVENMGDVLDCLMTTMCTDRILPSALDDYGTPTGHDIAQKYGSKIFERMATFETEKETFHDIYNDGEYSKLSMGPMWSEILDYLIPIVENKVPPEKATKFALFSGHDTTIIPLMASLGPKVWDRTEWPPYASMVNLEVHELIDGETEKSVYPSDFAFRLIYNGQVYTDRLDGCHKDHDLCDIKILLDRVMSFATRDRQCNGMHSETPALKTTFQLVSTPAGGALMLLVALLSCCGGIGCMWVHTYI